MNLVIMGPPGSGKGTQADLLKDSYKLTPLSTGELLRQAVRRKTQLGLEIASIMQTGQLVTDYMATEILREALEERRRKGERSFLFDGYPRTTAQAARLESMLDSMGTRLDAALRLVVSEAKVMERIGGRRVCRGCEKTYHLRYNPPQQAGICDNCGSTDIYQRSDDKEEVAVERLTVYENATAPVIERYRDRGLLIEIPANDTQDQVLARIVRALNDLDTGPSRWWPTGS